MLRSKIYSRASGSPKVLTGKEDCLLSANISLSELLRNARTAQGLTQDQVASAAGVSRVSVAIWEAERRSRDGPLVVPRERNLLAVTRHLGVDDEAARQALRRLKSRALREALDSI